jgi:hypothetical protein
MALYLFDSLNLGLQLLYEITCVICMHLYYTTVNLQKNIYLDREPKPLYTEDLCAKSKPVLCKMTCTIACMSYHATTINIKSF